MKVVACVPIKMNNERTPGKNTRALSDGTPLCQLMFNTLSSVKAIDDIFCFCSNPEIENYFSGRVKFLSRGGVLDTPLAKSQDILKAFFEKVDTDILVLAHVTSPFIKKETVEKCIEAVKSGEYDSAFSAGRVCDLLWKDGKPYNFDATNIVRTQDLPLIYRESCGVYVFTKEMFKETNRRIGFKPYICEISEIESIDVDYPEDFLIADAVYTKIIKK